MYAHIITYHVCAAAWWLGLADGIAEFHRTRALYYYRLQDGRDV